MADNRDQFPSKIETRVDGNCSGEQKLWEHEPGGEGFHGFSDLKCSLSPFFRVKDLIEISISCFSVFTVRSRSVSHVLRRP